MLISIYIVVVHVYYSLKYLYMYMYSATDLKVDMLESTLCRNSLLWVVREEPV